VNGLRQRLEKAGRRLLVAVLAVLFGKRARPVALPPAPRILVVRLDERLGNLILLTPLLASLRARFPRATIDLLAQERNRSLLAGHPALSELIGFDKRTLLARRGPLRTPFRLRRRHYDLALDAANPTDPSATQAIITLLTGATHTVGFASGPFGGLFSAPVSVEGCGPHEIDMRLGLLSVLPGMERLRTVCLGPLGSVDPGGLVGRWLKEHGEAPYVVINVGARLLEKRLDVDVYAALARMACESKQRVCITYGPAERDLALALATRETRALLAPPTDLLELAAVMRGACAVLTCDTGPMHLAVALGVPTCGIFVSTAPERYGHKELPHTVVDARTLPASQWLPSVALWLARA